MTVRSRIVIAVLWALSLFGVAQWTAFAQVRPQPGFEVRFLQAEGQDGMLVANFGGQWLPVKLVIMPDGNAR